MKAICPEHDGPIDVADVLMEDLKKGLWLFCPICGEEVEIGLDSLNKYKGSIDDLYQEVY